SAVEIHVETSRHTGNALSGPDILRKGNQALTHTRARRLSDVKQTTGLACAVALQAGVGGIVNTERAGVIEIGQSQTVRDGLVAVPTAIKRGSHGESRHDLMLEHEVVFPSVASLAPTTKDFGIVLRRRNRQTKVGIARVG